MTAGCAARAPLIFLELVVDANHCTSEQQDVVASPLSHLKIESSSCVGRPTQPPLLSPRATPFAQHCLRSAPPPPHATAYAG
jgi:hypothetical protein